MKSAWILLLCLLPSMSGCHLIFPYKSLDSDGGNVSEGGATEGILPSPDIKRDGGSVCTEKNALFYSKFNSMPSWLFTDACNRTGTVSFSGCQSTSCLTFTDKYYETKLLPSSLSQFTLIIRFKLQKKNSDTLLLARLGSKLTTSNVLLQGIMLMIPKTTDPYPLLMFGYGKKGSIIANWEHLDMVKAGTWYTVSLKAWIEPKNANKYFLTASMSQNGATKEVSMQTKYEITGLQYFQFGSFGTACNDTPISFDMVCLTDKV